MLRLLLIHLYKERIIKSPPIQPLNREKLSNSHDEKLYEGFRLKRSGTIVRSIRNIKHSHMRTWEPLSSNIDNNDNLNRSSVSEKDLILAEVEMYSNSTKYNSSRKYLFINISYFIFRLFIF